MQRIKNLISPLLVGLLVFVGAAGLSFAAVQYAGAQSLKDSACEGVALGGGSNCSDPGAEAAAQNQINTTVGTVINILSIIVGVAAVIMIIIGGFRYVTSGGDSASVNGAKNTILYAIIGLVVVALAQFIVRFVLGRL